MGKAIRWIAMPKGIVCIISIYACLGLVPPRACGGGRSVSTAANQYGVR